MADIFVSYAKTDRPLASKLVTMLEAQGWSVWWDTSLGAADLYRDEIMKQLAAARAVISIWTPNSIRSDWVRAEAGRAMAEGKLIPLTWWGIIGGAITLFVAMAMTTAADRRSLAGEAKAVLLVRGS